MHSSLSRSIKLIVHPTQLFRGGMEPDPRVQLISEYCYLFTRWCWWRPCFRHVCHTLLASNNGRVRFAQYPPCSPEPPVLSVGIFNAPTTSALGVRKFANCVPVRSLNRFSQWRP